MLPLTGHRNLGFTKSMFGMTCKQFHGIFMVTEQRKFLIKVFKKIHW